MAIRSVDVDIQHLRNLACSSQWLAVGGEVGSDFRSDIIHRFGIALCIGDDERELRVEFVGDQLIGNIHCVRGVVERNTSRERRLRTTIDSVLEAIGIAQSQNQWR